MYAGVRAGSHFACDRFDVTGKLESLSSSSTNTSHLWLLEIQVKKKILSVAAAVALFGGCPFAFATEAMTDGFPPAQNLNYHHMPGPDMAADGTNAPAGVAGQYLFLAGSAFTPRASDQTITYPAAGCTNSSGGFVVTSLELPDGAEVFGLRLYYYNNGSSGSVSGALSSYTGDGGYTDHILGNSTGNTGYSSEYFQATSLVIDNSQSYALLGSTGAGLSLCGIRVFYAP